MKKEDGNISGEKKEKEVPRILEYSAYFSLFPFLDTHGWVLFFTHGHIEDVSPVEK